VEDEAPPRSGERAASDARDQACAIVPGAGPALRAADARRWSDDDGEHVDVRGLQPPQPLVAILSLVQQLGDDGVVIVHHDREPALLYPELAQIGWQADALQAPAGEIRLRLSRIPGP
jgi:hypothetical protein